MLELVSKVSLPRTKNSILIYNIYSFISPYCNWLIFKLNTIYNCKTSTDQRCKLFRRKFPHFGTLKFENPHQHTKETTLPTPTVKKYKSHTKFNIWNMISECVHIHTQIPRQFSSMINTHRISHTSPVRSQGAYLQCFPWRLWFIDISFHTLIQTHYIIYYA